MKIRPYNGKWRADAGVVLGKRVQKVFERQKDAELWLGAQKRRRKEVDVGIRHLSPAKEHIAVLAYDHLGKHGITDDHALLDAAKSFVTASSPGKRTPLVNAMQAFERDLSFGNRSPVYIQQIGHVLNRFLSAFEDRQLHEIKGDDVLNWLQKNCASPANKANRRRELKVFFSWAVRQGLLTENPVDRVPRVSVDRGRPEILSVPQVRSALQHLEGEDRALFAVMVFAGLRPSEAEAIHWEDIKIERGFLEAKRGFRADNRNVKLSENLVAWLRPLVKTGLVFKGHTRRWRDRVQRAIAAEAEPLPTWPQDVLRHSYASYHLEKFKDVTSTSHEMGHRGSSRMIYSHYRDLVSPEEAEAFWRIYPAASVD